MKTATSLFTLLALIVLSPLHVSAETIQGPSSSRMPYALPSQDDITIYSILSGGDAVNGYALVGIPDGTGAYDNGNDTFTVLVNHELFPQQGKKRLHGSEGAFVSKWVITKPGHPEGTFKVLSGEDLIENVVAWDRDAYKYMETPQFKFNRLCSATLIPENTFYDPKSKKGTKHAFFMHGEESDSLLYYKYGRAFAVQLTGWEKGTSFELPLMGDMAFENVVPNPFGQERTVVGLLDDSAGKTIDNLGEVYFYVGTKRYLGKPIDKAGLTNGNLYGVVVHNMPVEDLKNGLPKYTQGTTTFHLGLIGNMAYDDGHRLFDKTKAHNKLGITKFLRPEDGHWDPTNRHAFYFTTTGARFDGDNDGRRESKGKGRLWKLQFYDIKFPRLGGKITCLLDGSEGVRKPDNITVDSNGMIYIQEDLGESKEMPRIWQFNPRNNELIEIAHLNKDFFHKRGKHFITDNKESSGIISLEHILGPGWFLATVQAHAPLKKNDPFSYSTSEEKELVEDGQIIILKIPAK